jgi:hypothetical protein
MASDDDKSLDSVHLSSAERAELEAREARRLEEMAKEVQRRYDPARLSRIEASAAGRAEKLDDQTRTAMERRLGTRFHDVRIVRGAFADRVTRRHRADAVTIGSSGLILLRDTPRTNMRTPEGKALLAHELTHVRQAQRGMHFAKEQGSEGAAHEREAERMERTVLRDSKDAQRGTQDVGPTKEELRERAVQRTLEKWEEVQRVEFDRRGIDDP